METSPSGSTLDETADVVDAFAGQEQDGRHIDQRIRTGTPGLGKAHGGAGAGHEDLSGQSRVVDAHVEREMLVGGEPGSADALHQHPVGGVRHAGQLVLGHLPHIQRIMAEIGVGLNRGLHGLKRRAFLKHHIDEAGMAPAAQRNGDRGGVGHAGNGAGGYGVAHGRARSW